jgi:hypothetical protein
MRTIRVRYSFAFVTAALALLAADGRLNAARAAAAPSPYATQIAALRTARKLLESADHDYDGHRAAAVKLVSAAIHALRPPSSTGAHAKGNAAKGAARAAIANQQQQQAPRMTQAASDGQLKMAMGQIAAVATQLSKASGTAPGAAVTELQKAVQELQTALSIK